MKGNKWIIFLLVVLAVTIWGYNLYQILFFSSEESPAEEKLAPITGNNMPGKGADMYDSFVYTGQFRDPFVHWLKTPGKQAKPIDLSAVKKEKEQPEIIPPILRLKGIIDDGFEALAMIEDPFGISHFSKQQDTIMGVTVLEINRRSIICQFNNKQFELFLGQ